MNSNFLHVTFGMLLMVLAEKGYTMFMVASGYIP